jgi:hypothetical protein
VSRPSHRREPDSGGCSRRSRLAAVRSQARRSGEERAFREPPGSRTTRRNGSTLAGVSRIGCAGSSAVPRLDASGKYSSLTARATRMAPPNPPARWRLPSWPGESSARRAGLRPTEWRRTRSGSGCLDQSTHAFGVRCGKKEADRRRPRPAAPECGRATRRRRVVGSRRKPVTPPALRHRARKGAVGARLRMGDQPQLRDLIVLAADELADGSPRLCASLSERRPPAPRGRVYRIG